MNDFTKEELEYLLDLILSDIAWFDGPATAYTIRDKIQSVIDNYC